MKTKIRHLATAFVAGMAVVGSVSIMSQAVSAEAVFGNKITNKSSTWQTVYWDNGMRLNFAPGEYVAGVKSAVVPRGTCRLIYKEFDLNKRKYCSPSGEMRVSLGAGYWIIRNA